MERNKKLKIVKNTTKGITLISLVVTIIILLILAGISIGMLSGDNGILQRATDAKSKTDIAGEKEILQISVLSAISKEKYGYVTKEKVDNELDKNVGNANYSSELVDGGIEVTFTNSGRTYIVDNDGNVEKMSPQIQIADAKVVTNTNGTGEDVTANSKTEGTDILYISFKPIISGGSITSVTYDGNTITPQNGIYVLEINKNGDYDFTINAVVEGKNISNPYIKTVDKYKLRSGINIGDYVDYVPTTVSAYSKDNLNEAHTGSTRNTSDLTQETLKWRVFRIYDDGKIDLIADPTTATVYFNAATGYNNGVYIMHDICKNLYSNSDHNIVARSISLEDFEDNMTVAGKTERDNYDCSGNSPQYGHTNYEKWNSTYYHKYYIYYPNIYAKENGSGIESTTAKIDGIKDTEKDILDLTIGNNAYKQAPSTGLTCKQTYYTLTINTANFGNACNLLLNNSNSYWIASRYVECKSNYPNFGLRRVGTSYIDGLKLFDMVGGTDDQVR